MSFYVVFLFYFFKSHIFHKIDYLGYVREFTKNTIVLRKWRTKESECLGQSNVWLELWLSLQWNEKQIRGKVMEPSAVASQLLKQMLLRWERIAQVQSKRVVLYLKSCLSLPHNKSFFSAKIDLHHAALFYNLLYYNLMLFHPLLL